MNKSILAFLGSLALVPSCTLGLGLPLQASPLPTPGTNPCSAVNGQWFFNGTPGPVMRQSGDHLTVNMSAYGRPTATGRFLSPTRIQVTFPDDATHTGTLNGRGRISWSNGTAWEARDFSGTWTFQGRPGPVVTQSGDRLLIDMTAYGRPQARGTVYAPAVAAVDFPDERRFTATLLSPTCMKWSNHTTWTK